MLILDDELLIYETLVFLLEAEGRRGSLEEEVFLNALIEKIDKLKIEMGVKK